MGNKRKQSITLDQSRKRVKGTPIQGASASPHPHGEIDPDEYFAVRSILDERPGQYLVDWDDSPRTGEAYQPTWEPKKNVTAAAIKEWKAGNAPPPSAAVPSTLPSAAASALPSATASPAPATLVSAPSKKVRGRPRKVIESSPDVSPQITRQQARQETSESVQLIHTPQTNARPEPEIIESQDGQHTVNDESTDSPLFEPVGTPAAEPSVEPSDPPASYYTGAYQAFTSSELGFTSASAPPTGEQIEGPLETQSRSVPVNFGEASSRVIPDSQTFVEFTSSAPAATTSSRSDQRNLLSQAEAIIQTPARLVNCTVPLAQAETGAPIIEGRTAEDTSAEPSTNSLLRDEPHQAQLDSQLEHTSSGARHEIDISQATQAHPAEETGGAETSPSLELHESLGSLAVVSQASSGGATALHDQDSPTTGPVNDQIGDNSARISQALAATPKSSDLVPPNPGGNIQSQSAADRGDTELTSQAQQSRLEDPIDLTTSTFPFQIQVNRSPIESPPGFTSLLNGSDTVLPSKEPPSPVRFSSPFPSVPSYSIGTFGVSAPPQPVFSSNQSIPAMRASQGSLDSRASLKAKLEASRAQRRAQHATNELTSARPSQSNTPVPQTQDAELIVSQAPKLVSSLIVDEQSRRSPSAFPAMEPPPVITQEEMNTSERYETLLPQTRENGLHRTGSMAAPTLSRQPSKDLNPPLSHTYVLPIALIGHQRDQYPATVHASAHLINELLTSAAPGADLLRDAEAFVTRMQNLTVHPDLVNSEALSQYAVEPRQQAQWDVDCSAKCRFLKLLIDELRDQSMHIAIVSQPGEIMNILDVFFSGISIPHRRLSDIHASSFQNEDQALTITLVSVEDVVVDQTPSPADLIIAMDSAVSAECMPIKALLRGEHRAPMVTMVVPYSVEHIAQSLSAALSSEARLRLMISSIQQYSSIAGSLEEGQASIRSAAEQLASYLMSEESEREWPLQTLEPLANLDSQTESDVEMPAALHEQDLENSVGIKRVHETSNDTTEAVKKIRLDELTSGIVGEAPLTISPQEIQMTHISDSVPRPTQVTSDGLDADTTLMLTDAEQSLRNMLRDAQTRLDDHVEAISKLQYRFEEQRADLVTRTAERDSALMTAAKAVERMQSNQNRLEVIQANAAETGVQLAQANMRLLDHTIPERAEIERVRSEAHQARSEKEQIEKRLERLNQEHEYLRSIYQTASQSAQNQSSQNTDLENALAVAQNKATSEQARLRSMGYDAQTTLLRDENKRLKVMLKDREAAIKFKEEELTRLKEAQRGRMGTRGTSVPRSPRVGSPMKMAVEGGMKGRGSRQGSPAAGEMRKGVLLHPLRNS
ncbi:hypothetical protein LTR78_000185 [Recurvomyces mirabilis]|uniref:Chromo domain-containing protein n=1 Tax=Recurvomyces mirabilis TaxID=574656 RepID=A0AAE0WXK2_9PEZI|nr:hypothetical protein LTR78_000185 [Recurvomyces mirabilis]KAK5161842.1 hypothetical protein LTS14_000187 [Recurvomyces mirabilis]